MKITVNVQDLQQYQKVKTFELGQPISVTNSQITFPTNMVVEVDSQYAVPFMTFKEFEELIIKKPLP